MQLQFNLTEDSSPKLCECGCGQPTPIATRNRTERGQVKGQPIRFIHGHYRDKYPPLEDRFWEKVDVRGPNECWLWQGSTAGDGYGRLGIDDKTILTHRLSWELHYGHIPDGLWVLHRCDVRNCVRPDHLFLGDNADNMQDKVDKGRQSRGVKHGGAKLTPENVRRIRELSEIGMSQEKIAVRFGVQQATIWAIIQGKTWAHIP